MPTPKTTPPAAEKLLPCPFCGGEARIEGMLQPGMAGAGELMGYQAMCQHCYVSTDGPVPKIEAIQQWNTRPQSSPDAPPVQRGVSEQAIIEACIGFTERVGATPGLAQLLTVAEEMLKLGRIAREERKKTTGKLLSERAALAHKEKTI